MLGNGLESLSQLFDPAKLHQQNNGSVVVIEKDKLATLKKLQIDGVGANAIALCFDKAGHSNPFKAGHGVRRACDAILFCALKDEGYILCFDLKSGSPSRDDAAQLKSAQCFVDYTLSILHEFHKVDCSKWKRRFFIFHDAKKCSVRKVSSKHHGANDKPDIPWIYPVMTGDKIYLRKLLNLPL